MKESKVSDNFKFKKISSPHSGKITNAIIDYLRNLILTNKLKSGSVFPREDLLSAELGVGRSTLREAYKILESEGLITRTKHGTSVNNAAEFLSLNSLTAVMQLSDFEDLIEFRAMVEGELAGLAAERATDEQVENLQQLLTSMRSHQDDLVMLTFYDTQFHLEIAEASHNNILITTMRSAIGTFAKGIFNAFHLDTEANIKQALQYHENILFAIQQRDKTMAYNIMRSHVQSVLERIRKSKD